MNAKDILNNLLQNSQQATQKGLELAENKLGVPESGPERDAMLGGMGKGALAAGAVALLLGTKSGRKLTGSAVKVGGLAAVGGLAYKAFTDWQNQQAKPVEDIGTPVAQLPDAAAQKRSEVLVRAMIAAAKADGHIDQNEQETITKQINSLGLEQDFSSFLLAELNAPVNVAELANAADSPDAAAEIYLASAMVVDLNNATERAYMDALGKELKLDPALLKQLEDALV